MARYNEIMPVVQTALRNITGVTKLGKTDCPNANTWRMWWRQHQDAFKVKDN